MKKKLQIVLVAALAACMVLINAPAHAQTWQWGRRGGSQFNGTNSQPHEQIKDIATDKNGNVYALGLVESSGGANVDAHALTLFGFKDVVLTSFTCNGTYRWTKVIGGTSDDLPIAVATDTVGHVFVASINYTPAHFGTDTVSPANSQKFLSLVQYDTAGNFKWLRQPQSDTGTFSYMADNSDSYDLHVEGNGDAYWFCQLSAGLVSGGGGWALPAPATCVLKYNVQGTLATHIVLQMQTRQVAFQGIGITVSKTGKIIIGGTYDNLNNTGTFSIGGQVISNPVMFLAAFDQSGQNNWKKTSTSAAYGSFISCRPLVDGQGNIYYSGRALQNNTFNGFAFYNSITTISTATPFIGKTDSNGNHLWIKCAGGRAAATGTSISLKGSNEVLLSGSGNSVWWDTAHHVQGAPNEGYYIYTSRFDASGNILGMDSLKGTFGAQNYTYCNAVDKNGNLYMGGEFNLTLNIASGQSIINGGGDSDFFITKLGYPCGCTAPASNFNSATTAIRTVQFTYTGSTTIDSLRWNFGDGQSQKVTSNFTMPLSHTYASNGSYSACATVYNSCGTNTYCKQYSLSVGDLNALDAIKTYPNPFADNLMIEGAQGATAVLINSVGQQVLSFRIKTEKESVPTSGIVPGVYILSLQLSNGSKGALKVIRQ